MAGLVHMMRTTLSRSEKDKICRWHWPSRASGRLLMVCWRSKSATVGAASRRDPVEETARSSL